MSIGSRFRSSTNWIMNTPESLVILLLMGTGIASLFFTTLFVSMLIAQEWFFAVLFAFFGYGSIMQFIKIYRMVKQFGLKEAMGGFTANEFVWHKNKYGRKIEDGNYGTEQTVKSCNGSNEETNGRIGEEVRRIYR